MDKFERANNKVRLTEVGQFLYGKAKRVLEESEQLVKQARELSQSLKKELHIGYIANVHGALVIESATPFRQAHPGVTVKVFDSTTADQVAALVAGTIDLGFVGFQEAPLQEHLRIERIGTAYAIMALARQHRLAGRRRQPLAVFKDEPFVTISDRAFPGARQYVLSFCREAGFQPRIIHEALQPIDILNLVAIGEGVALVPERMRQAPHPGVVFCDLCEPVPRVDSFVAWRTGNTSELLLDFVRIAKTAYSSLLRDFDSGRS
jgi:DNA-binding transcriptional LysR family regulator